MSFFQKRSVAILCCIVMIAIALCIGEFKAQHNAISMQEDLPSGWTETVQHSGFFGYANDLSWGTSLRIVIGIAVFVLLIGGLVLLSLISAISRLAKRLVFDARGKKPVGDSNKMYRHNGKATDRQQTI